MKNIGYLAIVVSFLYGSYLTSLDKETVDWLLFGIALALGILVGLGFYLPFNIVVTYSLGTMTRLLVDRKQGPRFSEEVGIPMAAGLIVGEALVGVGNAMYYVFAN